MLNRKAEQIAMDYIETGMMPNELKLNEFLDIIPTLSVTEQQSLKVTINEKIFPNGVLAELKPFTNTVPKAALRSSLAGIAGGYIDYQYSNDIYSASKFGFNIFSFTLLGQLKYNGHQHMKQWNEQCKRAKEILRNIDVSVEIKPALTSFKSKHD